MINTTRKLYLTAALLVAVPAFAQQNIAPGPNGPGLPPAATIKGQEQLGFDQPVGNGRYSTVRAPLSLLLQAIQPAGPGQLGGVLSASSTPHEWLFYIDASGVQHFLQPGCGDLSNASPSCSTDTTNAANISSGTLPAARIPAPAGSTLGGVKSATAATHQFQTGISAAGAPTFAQPGGGDLTAGALAAGMTATTQSNTDTTTDLATNQFAQNILTNATGNVAGAVGNGSTNNATVINAAMTAAANGGQVHLPCGTYVITSALVWNVADNVNADFGGSGNDCTFLEAVGAFNPLTINYGGRFSSASVHDLTITTNQAGTQKGVVISEQSSNPNAGISAQARVENVNFYGTTQRQPGLNDYFGTAVDFEGVSNVSANNISCLGGPLPGAGHCVFINGNEATVTAANYNSTTGLVIATLSKAPVIHKNETFTIYGATGTGSFASINGLQTAAADSSGTTITFTIATGLTMTITGANYGNYAVVFNLSNIRTNFIGDCVYIDDFIQGVTALALNCTGGVNGVAQNPSPAGLIDQVHIGGGSQFGGNSGFDVLLSAPPANLLDANVTGPNYFLAAAAGSVGNGGIFMAGARSIASSNNFYSTTGSLASNPRITLAGTLPVANGNSMVSAAGAGGTAISTSGQSVTVNGNGISGYATGIAVASGASGVNLSNNTQSGNTVDYGVSGSASNVVIRDTNPRLLSQLPVCGSAIGGSTFLVANSAASPTYDGSITATGSTPVTALCNGGSYVAR